MNKNQNNRNHSLFESENNKTYQKICETVFAVKRIPIFDFFQHSINCREKLQIIYANIRV